MIKHIHLLWLLNLTITIQATNPVWIIVHGTWAKGAKWYRPGGDFYEALKTSLKDSNDTVISFEWCGSFAHAKRQQAGHKLAHLIQSYSPDTLFVLVAHSHGGNVGMIASQFLRQHRIIEFYALGTPIETSYYQPNFKVIKRFYNLFSFGDPCQSVMGFHQRELPPHPHVYNINIEINGRPPAHEEMHHPVLAQNLKLLPRLTETLKIKQPLLARFTDKQFPEVQIDLNFQHKLEVDLQFHQMLNLHLLGTYPDERYQLFNRLRFTRIAQM